MNKLVLGSAVAAALGLSAATASAATLDDVQAKGSIQCGVSQGLPGFSNTDDAGNWTGLDVDFCRAMAAAIFDDADAVRYTPLSAKERFTALQSGEVDVLSRNTTWTMQRDTALGLNFAGVTYYDGQGFMVRKDLGVASALELSGASVCTNTGTTTELNVADYFRANNMPYEIVAFEKADEVVQAYDAGRCDVYTTDASGLYAQRLKLTNPDDHMVLPEIISKEPLGPVVRHGDDQFLDIVKWTLNAVIEAEEYGITAANADEMANTTTNPGIQRLLGKTPGMGKNLGLDEEWALRAIKAVGNYGEIWTRNIEPLGLPRGLNNLWSNGGILYAPPVR